MISSDSRQHLNFAVLLLAISLHVASIAAANYVFSLADVKSADMRLLTVQLVPDSLSSPIQQFEAPAAALNAPSKPLLRKKQVMPKSITAAKPLVPAIKTAPSPVPEVSIPEAQRSQKMMPDHVTAAPSTTAESTLTSAAPVAAIKTSVSIPASYAASNRRPEYPKLSQRFEEQGTTVLHVFVQSDGSAGEVQIRKSSGYDLLDESARTAVRSWRFNPATRDGKAIAEWYQISIPFTLQN